MCVCVAAAKSAEKLTPELVLVLFYICIQHCSLVVDVLQCASLFYLVHAFMGKNLSVSCL